MWFEVAALVVVKVALIVVNMIVRSLRLAGVNRTALFLL